MLGAEEYAAAVSTGRLLARDESIAESRAVTRGKRGSSSKPLTRREIDVLRLLVTGYSDRAIGDELFIGTRTVESHVARIFAKLGVQSRAAATATALSTGLVEPAEERPSAP
jgi:DNA-binding NarL/FixJ family response regulator